MLLTHEDKINNIMNEIDWSNVSFTSTNGAYNLRFDIIERIIWDRLPTQLKDRPVGLEKFI